MVKRTTTLVLILLLTCFNSYSCDVCGGFSGGFSMLNSFKKNSLQLGYKYVRYNASSRLGYKTKDVFQLLNVELNYRPKPRLILNIAAPILFKKRYVNGETKSKNGLGDINVLGKYVLVNDKTNKKKNTYLEVGTGLKLKNGQYQNNIVDENLPKSFNLGNGSLGVPIYARFIVSKKGHGFIAITNYQYNFETATGHTFGNNYSSSISVFEEIKTKGSSVLIPQLSIVYEGQGKDHYPNKKEDLESGGKLICLMPGLNLKTKKCLMGLAFQIPIIQQFNNETLATKTELNMQVSYLF